MPSGDSRLTDWDMPEANEQQQTESSVNHRIVMGKKTRVDITGSLYTTSLQLISI